MTCELNNIYNVDSYEAVKSIPEFKKFWGRNFDTAQYCFVRVDKDGDYTAFVDIVRSFEFNDITAAIREELKQKKRKKK